jgi:hypothetical protein
MGAVSPLKAHGPSRREDVMPYTRRLVLACATALATIALTAPSASAQAVEYLEVSDVREFEPEEVHSEFRICLDSVVNLNATGTHCTAEVKISQNPMVGDPHNYLFDLVEQPCPGLGNFVELDASWYMEVVEEDGPLEIQHI